MGPWSESTVCVTTGGKQPWQKPSQRPWSAVLVNPPQTGMGQRSKGARAGGRGSSTGAPARGEMGLAPLGAPEGRETSVHCCSPSRTPRGNKFNREAAGSKPARGAPPPRRPPRKPPTSLRDVSKKPHAASPSQWCGTFWNGGVPRLSPPTQGAHQEPGWCVPPPGTHSPSS